MNAVTWLVFPGPVGRLRGDRTLAFMGEGVLSPLSELGVHGGTEPSAHALGYHLAALRAWGHGSGQGWWVGFVSLVSFVENSQPSNPAEGVQWGQICPFDRSLADPTPFHCSARSPKVL
jgi:hypothetical protein